MRISINFCEAIRWVIRRVNEGDVGDYPFVVGFSKRRHFDHQAAFRRDYGPCQSRD